MKTNRISIVALCLVLSVVIGCSFTTANISSFKLAKDKAGNQAASDFKAGDTIYGLAQISNNGGKVKVKFRLLGEAGDAVKDSEVTVDMEGDGVATYTLTTPQTMKGGNYKVVAEMLTDGNEKKDEKTATFKMTGAPAAEEKKESDENNN